MINGYKITNDLKFELGFNKDFLPIIQKNDLLNDTTLVSVLKWLFPKLQGHSKLLYWKGNPITKLEEVIAYEYLNILTRQELVNFIESKGYSEQTTYLVTRSEERRVGKECGDGMSRDEAERRHEA